MNVTNKEAAIAFNLITSLRDSKHFDPDQDAVTWAEDYMPFDKYDEKLDRDLKKIEALAKYKEELS